MAVIAFNPSYTWPYSLKSDKAAQLQALRKQFNAAPSDNQPAILERIAKLEELVGSEQPTVFMLGVLDGPLRAHLDDSNVGFSMNNLGGNQLADINWKNNARNLSIVRFGVRGWTNLKDADGNDVPFDTQSIPVPSVDGGNRQGVSSRAFKAIDPSWYAELAEQIMAGNRLTEEETKNS